MRSLTKNETRLALIASILIILVLHHRLLNHHRILENTLTDLHSQNAILEKRYIDTLKMESRTVRSPDELMNDRSYSLIPFDELTVTHRNDSILFEFRGSTMQLWNLLLLLRTITDIALVQFEFNESTSGIAGLIELRIIPA